MACPNLQVRHHALGALQELAAGSHPVLQARLHPGRPPGRFGPPQIGPSGPGDLFCASRQPGVQCERVE